MVGMEYVYIDESGSEGRSGRYIVFASISTSDARGLDKAIKKLWWAKPQYHIHGELHAYDVDDSMRKRVLLTIGKLDIEYKYHLVDKHSYKNFSPDDYYSELAKFIKKHKSHKIVVDKRETNKKRNNILGRLGLGAAFKYVEFTESYKIRQLQAVDFVAWAVGRKYENNDETFYKLLRI